MVNLIGVFIRIDEDEPLDKRNILYPISLIFPNKTRQFFFIDKNLRE